MCVALSVVLSVALSVLDLVERASADATEWLAGFSWDTRSDLSERGLQGM